MSEVERVKRRLIRAVARFREQNTPEDEMWEQLAKDTKCDCKVLWDRMRSLTLKKLQRLLAADDKMESIAPVAQMAKTDWMLFDLVLVHEKVDVITLEKSAIPAGEKKSSQCKALVELFNLVQRFDIEGKQGEELANSWTAATMFYNKGNKLCSPMLLQLRWYQLKQSARNLFYEFWIRFRGTSALFNAAKEAVKPTMLQIALAKRYPEIVTTPFLEWEDMIQQRLVILIDEFEAIIKGCRDLPVPSDANDPDLVVVEPEIETIDLGDDSDGEIDAEARSTNETVNPDTQGNANSTFNDKNIPVQNQPDENDQIADFVTNETKSDKHDINKQNADFVTSETTLDQRNINGQNAPSLTSETTLDQHNIDGQNADSVTSETKSDQHDINDQKAGSLASDQQDILDQSADSVINKLKSDQHDIDEHNAVCLPSETKSDHQDNDDQNIISETNKVAEILMSTKELQQLTNEKIEQFDPKSQFTISNHDHLVDLVTIDSGKEPYSAILLKETGKELENKPSTLEGEQKSLTTQSENESDSLQSNNRENFDKAPSTSVIEIESENEENILNTKSSTGKLENVYNKSHKSNIGRTSVDVISSSESTIEIETENEFDNIAVSKTLTTQFVSKTSNDDFSVKLTNSLTSAIEIDSEDEDDIFLPRMTFKPEQATFGKEETLSQKLQSEFLEHESDSNAMPHQISIVASDIDEEQESNSGESEDQKCKNDSSKFDLKLLMYPVVYTMKLDHMNIFQNYSFDNTKCKDVIIAALVESKPLFTKTVGVLDIENKHVKEQFCDDDRKFENDLFQVQKYESQCLDSILKNSERICENYEKRKEEPSSKEGNKNQVDELHRISLNSQLVKKPKYRTYNPIMLCKNPDFNTRLKKLNLSFFTSERNRHLLNSCKPMTIDLHKDFEKHLINGTVFLKSAHMEPIKEMKEQPIIKNNSVIPTSGPVESLMNTTRFEVDEVVQSTTTFERKKSINLPNIDYVRKINQQLLTAEVTPMRINVGPNVTQIIRPREISCPLEKNVKLDTPIKLENDSDSESNTVSTIRNLSNFVNDGLSVQGTSTLLDKSTEKKEEIINTNTKQKCAKKTPKLQPWYSQPINYSISKDSLLTIDALHKMLDGLQEIGTDLQSTKKKRKKGQPQDLNKKPQVARNPRPRKPKKSLPKKDTLTLNHKARKFLLVPKSPERMEIQKNSVLDAIESVVQNSPQDVVPDMSTTEDITKPPNTSTEECSAFSLQETTPITSADHDHEQVSQIIEPDSLINSTNVQEIKNVNTQCLTLQSINANEREVLSLSPVTKNPFFAFDKDFLEIPSQKEPVAHIKIVPVEEKSVEPTAELCDVTQPQPQVQTEVSPTKKPPCKIKIIDPLTFALKKRKLAGELNRSRETETQHNLQSEILHKNKNCSLRESIEKPNMRVYSSPNVLQQNKFYKNSLIIDGRHTLNKPSLTVPCVAQGTSRQRSSIFRLHNDLNQFTINNKQYCLPQANILNERLKTGNVNDFMPFIGKNHVLLSNIRPPSLEMRQKIALPDGVKLVLLPCGEVSCAIDNGVELGPEQLASLTQIIDIAKKQIVSGALELPMVNTPVIAASCNSSTDASDLNNIITLSDDDDPPEKNVFSNLLQTESTKAENTSRNLLSDLMEMSGITDEDTSQMLPPQDDKHSNHVVTETTETVSLGNTCVPPESSETCYTQTIFERPIPTKPYTLQLNPVTFVSDLKYCVQKKAQFFKLDLDTGTLTRINVNIRKKQVKATARDKVRRYTPKLKSILKQSHTVVDLTDDNENQKDKVDENIQKSFRKRYVKGNSFKKSYAIRVENSFKNSFEDFLNRQCPNQGSTKSIVHTQNAFESNSATAIYEPTDKEDANGHSAVSPQLIADNIENNLNICTEEEFGEVEYLIESELSEDESEFNQNSSGEIVELSDGDEQSSIEHEVQPVMLMRVKQTFPPEKKKSTSRESQKQDNYYDDSSDDEPLAKKAKRIHSYNEENTQAKDDKINTDEPAVDLEPHFSEQITANESEAFSSLDKPQSREEDEPVNAEQLEMLSCTSNFDYNDDDACILGV